MKLVCIEVESCAIYYTYVEVSMAEMESIFLLHYLMSHHRSVMTV